MGVELNNPRLKAVNRWIKPYAIAGTAGISGVGTVGRVYMCEFEVTENMIVDAIAFYNHATIAGNVTVGIYGPIVTEETPLNSPLLVESASTAHAGANAVQIISITETSLKIGRYYVAAEFSDGTATFGRLNIYPIVNGWTGYYDRGGGYGALTDPCPATTTPTSSTPNLIVRCKV